jgi:hypothetical protein
MKNKDVLEKTVFAASCGVRCAGCGVEEEVFLLDGQPIDDVFTANYLCDECEVVAETMQMAARSKVISTPALHDENSNSPRQMLSISNGPPAGSSHIRGRG